MSIYADLYSMYIYLFNYLLLKILYSHFYILRIKVCICRGRVVTNVARTFNQTPLLLFAAIKYV